VATGNSDGAVAGPPASRLREAGEPRDAGDTDVCALRPGTECGQCPRSAELPAQGRTTVEHAGHATTIARVTCPTAPRFWRWRNRPLPRFVPREIRLPEDEHAENEWKPQLAAAALCALAGLAGAALGRHPTSVWLFALSYLAGAWHPAIEAWERLRDRRPTSTS
jgi:Cd2+/Zn2+-exporting ATPase